MESLAPSRLDGVRAEIKDLFGFEARFSHFAIPGLCARCADAIGSDQPVIAESRSGRTGGRARGDGPPDSDPLP